MTIKKPTNNGGVTLIEVLIYSLLLSFLISNFIEYVSAINEGNIRLMSAINDSTNE